MRRFFVIFIIFLIIFGVIFALFNIPFFKDKIEKLSDNIFYGEIEQYSENFQINELKIKNQSYYYNKLSEENKKIYTSIANAVKNLDNNFVLKDYTIIDNETTMKDVETTMQAFFADHPEVFYVENEYIVTNKKTILKSYIEVSLNYSVNSKYDLNMKVQEIKVNMQEYLKRVEGKISFEAELEIHDMLGENIEYDEYEDLNDISKESHTIYGAFVEKRAVCDGFAKALQILLDQKDIESIIVFGNLESEAHAWNMVKLDDGWYHVDLTSNKSIKEEKVPYVLHTYFNLTNEQIQATHKIQNIEVIPDANLIKYNYFNYTNKKITLFDNFNTKFKQLLDNNSNQYFLEFGVENINSVAEKMVDFLSRNKYQEYVLNNRITYYSLLDSFVLMKQK